jgi:hypothetical protein
VTVADGLGLDQAFTQDLAIAAAGASYLHFCFEIALPDVEDIDLDDPAELQGRTVAPAWEFISTSD